jgi:hypothetical protein
MYLLTCEFMCLCANESRASERLNSFRCDQNGHAPASWHNARTSAIEMLGAGFELLLHGTPESHSLALASQAL